jgi:phage terminase large subunit GpA-like protein
MFAAQLGKSETGNNWLGYIIDNEPGPVMIVQPTTDMAKRFSRQRITPMLEETPVLRRKVRENRSRDDANTTLMKDFAGGVLVVSGANSAASLRSMPVRYLFLDEIDAYPLDVDGEGDPVALAEKRTRTFPHRKKIWKLSTPTVESGPIWVALTTEAQVVFDYHVRCPHCGTVQLMAFERICHRDAAPGHWPDDQRHPKEIEARRLARYACAKCPVKWTDADRNEAVRLGQWLARGPHPLSLDAALLHHRPMAIGFHIPSWLSPFVGLSAVMGAWFKAGSDPKELKDFQSELQKTTAQSKQENPNKLSPEIQNKLDEVLQIIVEGEKLSNQFKNKEALEQFKKALTLAKGYFGDVSVVVSKIHSKMAMSFLSLDRYARILGSCAE